MLHRLATPEQMRGGGDEEQFWPHARLDDPEQLNADVAEADGIRCHEEDEEDAEETEGDPGEDVRHRVNFACVKPAHCSTTRQPANFCAKRSERGGGAQLPTDRVVKLSSCQVVKLSSCARRRDGSSSTCASQVVRRGETTARQLVANTSERRRRPTGAG